MWISLTSVSGSIINYRNFSHDPHLTPDTWEGYNKEHFMKFQNKIFLLLLLCLANDLFAHSGMPGQVTSGGHDDAVLRRTYQARVEPIFRAKCFNCHSSHTRFPWYYRIPGVKQLIDYDIREAREHVDMTDGFPFKGHHSTEEQLKDLGEVVRDNEMPLWRYRLLHPGSGLTEAERATILQWISEGRRTLP